MYILETEQAFDAAHFLSGYQGKCSNIHGHRWRVIARIAAEELRPEGQARGMVVDFKELKEALYRLTDALDHTLIIEAGSLRPETMEALHAEHFAVSEMPFRPTAEQLARYFYEKLSALSFPVYEVSVYETPGNRASYRGDSF